MAHMREIKLRMKGIRQTRQITRAMKLISAAKLKKARQQLEATLPFFDKVKSTIADILLHSANIESIFFDERNGKGEKKRGYIVVAADKGLAGGYNNNILKFAESRFRDDRNAVLFVAGHMGKGYFTKKKYNVYKEFDYPVQNPTIYRAREISETVLELFKRGELDEVYIIYTRMISTIRLEPQLMKLLPLDMESLKEDIKDVRTRDEGLVYEPSPLAVLDVLISKYLKGIVYGAFVESFTSEQSARMTAMDNATTNADEMLQRLNLSFNRARQAAITQEISEIVGGAATLQ